jgi:hypothetical protein
VSTIGYDCEIMLDSNGYFVKPGTYQVKQPRVRHMTYRADGSLAYVDLGPGRRTWEMVILCRNDLLRYDGSSTGISGQQYRDFLRNSYMSNVGATVNFVDPLNGTAIPVHFDNYEEKIIDLHSQIISLATGTPPTASYEVAITLVEA